MFTLPGTPVLRYGDEIGMGDDQALPERQAVQHRNYSSPRSCFSARWFRSTIHSSSRKASSRILS